MSISAVGTPSLTTYQFRNESSEGPGPDKVNDHDSDDTKAAAAPGTGKVLDKIA